MPWSWWKAKTKSLMPLCVWMCVFLIAAGVFSVGWLLLFWYIQVPCVLSHFSHVPLFATLWTVALQAPLSMGFPRQEYWSGLPFFLQRIFPTQGSNLCFLCLLQYKWILYLWATREVLCTDMWYKLYSNYFQTIL